MKIMLICRTIFLMSSVISELEEKQLVLLNLMYNIIACVCSNKYSVKSLVFLAIFEWEESWQFLPSLLK